MKDIKAFIEEFFSRSEARKIRSEIIPIIDVTEFQFNADRLKPYSFEIFNTGAVDMFINGVVVLPKLNGVPSSLNFPRVGIFKRNDVINIDMSALGTMTGYIRVDLELTG